MPDTIRGLTLLLTQILFGPQSQALFDDPPDVLDYEWILVLALLKPTSLPRLAKVFIAEIVEFKTVPSIDLISHRMEWEYPQGVLDIYRAASVELKVVLRYMPAPQRREK